MKTFLMLALLISSSAFATPAMKCSLTKQSTDMLDGVSTQVQEFELAHDVEGYKVYSGSASTEVVSGYQCSAVASVEIEGEEAPGLFLEVTLKTPVGSFTSGGHFSERANVNHKEAGRNCSCWFTKQQ